MLESTSTRLLAPGAAHDRAPDKVPARRLKTIGLAGKLGIPFTTGILIGIGETHAERVDVAPRHPRPARALRPHPGGHRAELPRQAIHPDAGGARARRGRSPPHGGGRPPPARSRDEHPGAAEPDGRRLRPARGGGPERLGRHLAPDPRSHQPRARRGRPSWSSSAGPRPPGTSCASALRSIPSTRDAPNGSTRASATASTPSSAPTGSSSLNWRGGETGDDGDGDQSGLGGARDAPHPRRVPRGRRAVGGGRRSLCARSRGATCRPSPSPPTRCAGGRRATSSPTSSTATSTSPTSASSTARSAPSAATTARRRATSCRWTRSSGAPSRRGRWARPRCASRRGSRRSSTARTTSTCAAPSRRRCPRCTCTRSRPRRSCTARRARGIPIPEYLAALRAAGLGTLPGTSAEILDQEIRDVIARGRITVEQWIEVITTAHAQGIRTTSTIMYGHVERPEHWIRAHEPLARASRRTRAASPSSCRCR